MASKDVTSFFGSFRFFLPLILIFSSLGSANACPKHTSKSAHRTKAINSRTVSYLTQWSSLMEVARADDRYGTRRVKYSRCEITVITKAALGTSRSVGPCRTHDTLLSATTMITFRRGGVRYVARDDFDYAPRSGR